MIYISETEENYCTIEGSSADLEEVKEYVLEQVRPKEKSILKLHKLINGELTFPSGLLGFVEAELTKLAFDFESNRLPKLPKQKVSDDLLYSGPDPITLRDYQVTSVRKALSHRMGIFNLPTGSGKTEIIIGVAKIFGSSLTIVPSKSSLKQTFKRFRARGLKNVGRFGGGYQEFKDHTIATASMFNSRLKLGDLETRRYLNGVELLMFDEVHHLGTAPTWQLVGDSCPARRRYGFSGSPWASGMPCVDLAKDKESKYADFRVAAQVGETLVYIPSKMLREMGVIVEPRIFVIPVSMPRGLQSNPFPKWKWVYRRGIIENQFRNNLVAEASQKLFDRGHRTAILVVSIPHGMELLRLLHERGLKAAFTKGEDEVFVYKDGKVKSMKDAGEKYREAFLAEEVDVLIGSVVMDEAVDLPSMSALILAGGMKSPIRAVQRVGRAIRTSDGKDEAIILDFRDKQHYFLNNHTNKRLMVYRAHEYNYEEVEWDGLWKLI